MPNESTALGDLEGAVLEVLWDSGPLSTPAVHEAVGVPRGLAYTTILTVLQRLHKKGLVGRKEQSRAHVYFAAQSREEFASRRGQILATALAGLGEAGLAAFLAETERLDPTALKAMRARLGAVQ